MAPQTSIPIAANVLGTIGTIFWCIQLFPQIWYNWKQKKTDGLPGLMMFIWAVSAVPLGVYVIVQYQPFHPPLKPLAFPLMPINQRLASMESLPPRLRNRSLIRRHPSPAYFDVTGTSQVPVLSLLPREATNKILKGPYGRGVEWPITLVGVISAILLAGGLIPPYFEIAKRNGRVVGINFVFLAIDWLGAFFSLMALVAQNTFDILGGVQYLV
ncbi:MAG: hypothetical protein Q9225_006543, partial [Loekoesia sp. 1 TL-2023]